MCFRSGYRRQQLGESNIQLELEATEGFENMLHDKIQELEIELGESNTAREKEVLVNEMDTLECVLGHLFNLKSDNDETRAMGIVEANYNCQQTNGPRKQLIKIQDVASEISAQIQN